MSSPSPDHCRKIVPLLCSRDGQRTHVLLADGRLLGVFDIAWGEDFHDDFEHLTTNASPGIDGAVVDLFFTDEVVRITDPQTGAALWIADGTPLIR